MNRFLCAAALTCVVVASPRWAVADGPEDDSVAAEHPCRLGGGGCFLATDGRLRDVDAAYRNLVRRGRPHYIRAAIEMALALGGGTAWYWIDRDRQVADWDFPSIKQRVTFEAWRFDNNPFGINFIWHAMSGTEFHTVTRSNDLSLLQSVGYGFATSMLWEFAGEFREKVSINDVMVTPGAGVTMGEFFHWLGRYLETAPDGVGNRIGRWTVGAPRAFHNQLDGRSPQRTDPIWHQFRFGYSVGRGRTKRRNGGAEQGGLDLHEVAFHGRLVAMPGYLRPGRFRRSFADGNMTSLQLRATFSGDDSGVDVLADTTLFGVYRQDIPARGRGRLGRGLMIGSSIAYQYRREQLGGWADRLGILHFPGLALNGDLVQDRWRLHAEARLHADFAGVHSLPQAQWEDANPDALEKTILRKQSYYYGWGYSGRLSVEISVPHADIGGTAFFGHYYSQQGLDRSQEDINADVKADDRVLDYDAWIRLAPFDPRIYLEGKVSQHRREAQLEEFTDVARFRRYSLGLGGRW